jgi:hypothetical protein
VCVRGYVCVCLVTRFVYDPECVRVYSCVCMCMCDCACIDVDIRMCTILRVCACNDTYVYDSTRVRM